MCPCRIWSTVKSEVGELPVLRRRNSAGIRSMPPKRNKDARLPPQQPSKQEHPQLHPNAQYLRTQVKWAAVCQYLTTFHPAIGVQDYTVQTLEDDLVESTFVILPKLMHKMLYTLTLDRRINSETWQIYLRKQHIKRDPDTNPLGTEEEPIEWVTLPIESKLDVLHRVTEWPFSNPTRVRQLMNDDDNYANWRIEPIGYDAKRNAYWFIGVERLWIQRIRPSFIKSKKSASKKKKPVPAPKVADAPPPKKRGRPPKVRLTVSVSASESRASSAPRRSKRTAVLEAQGPASKRRRMLGTRMSSRLRGKDDVDEWQEIPDEWLDGDDDEPGSSSRAKGKGKAHSAFGDDEESDLTELSDEDEDIKSKIEENVERRDGSEDNLDESRDGISNKGDDEGMEEDKKEGMLKVEGDDWKSEEMASGHHAESADEPEPRSDEAPLDPDDPNFIEWETICITLDDWHQLTERFARSTSTYEKALYKRLSQDLVPHVTEVFKERERVFRQVEEVVGRKRSSRLALIDAEKERQRMEAAAKAEEDAKLDRTRRMEARERAQAVERERREKGREERKKDQDVNTASEPEADDKNDADSASYGRRSPRAGTLGPSIPEGESQQNGGHSRPVRKTRTAVSYAQSPDGATPPSERESWELACEICHKKGWNIDDGRELMACEKCGKWQHTECHDLEDDRMGRPRRDWNTVEFVCKVCQKRRNRNRNQGAGPTHDTNLATPPLGPSLATRLPSQYPQPGLQAPSRGSNPNHAYPYPSHQLYVNGNFANAPGLSHAGVRPQQPPPLAPAIKGTTNGVTSAPPPVYAGPAYPPQYPIQYGSTYRNPYTPQNSTIPHGSNTYPSHPAPMPTPNQRASYPLNGTHPVSHPITPSGAAPPTTYPQSTFHQPAQPFRTPGASPALPPYIPPQGNGQQSYWQGQPYGYNAAQPLHHNVPSGSSIAPSQPVGQYPIPVPAANDKQYRYPHASPYDTAQMLAYQTHNPPVPNGAPGVPVGGSMPNGNYGPPAA
ncbi:hypothetical protein FRB99_002286 [Tulasnella sp. 403]|nr:hypothetical protein FRB99_002286 [Tulasnella sp. 403]